MSSITLASFVKNEVNRSTYITSNRLDRILKGIYNNYSKKLENVKTLEAKLLPTPITSNDTTTILIYLNTLRTTYYLRRVEFRNPSKAKELKGKFYLLFTITSY